MLEKFEMLQQVVPKGKAVAGALLKTQMLATQETWNVRDIVFSPYEDKSPVKFLKDFFNNARHLDEELAMSSLGRLLGAAELGGTAKEGDIWQQGK